MPETLDLDALAPEPRQIKVRGKTYLCTPLTIQQIIELSHLEERFGELTTLEEIAELIKNTLGTFMPAIKEEKTIDFTIDEMWKIVNFAKSFSIPSQRESESAKVYDHKKKLASQEDSPSSSTSIKDTPPKTPSTNTP